MMVETFSEKSVNNCKGNAWKMEMNSIVANLVLIGKIGKDDKV